MDKLKLCLIGAGRAGMVHARNYQFEISNTKIVAVVDANKKVAEEAAKELNASNFFIEFEEALAGVEFDAVCIGAPTFVHAETVIRAADAGKHIFCEKPLSTTLKEAEQMENAIKRNNVKFQIGFMRRFDQNFLKAKKIIDQGEIGNPILVKSVGRGPGLPPQWYCDVKRSNGLLAEVNSHDFDSLRWLSGSDYEQVYALADNFKCPQYKEEYPDFYDTAAVSLRFKNGVLGLIDGCCPATYGYDARMEILGTEGMLQIGSQQASSVLVWNNKSQLIKEGNKSWRILFKDAYLEEDKHFANCILNNEEPKVSIEDGKKAIEIVIAANKSIETGQPVKL
jgi:myo-inositol 2-dehydrogenase/D-chiro-inositol 1-dehydrogenase/scyllo-inositol 2-dehydrogenase (NAD+)